MAEFTEVIRNKKRMCASCNNCEGCPISSDNNGANITCNPFMMNYPQEAEEIILKWAEEHPIKTNADVAKEFLLEKIGFDMTELNIDFNKCSYIRCKESDCDNCKYKGFWEQEYKESK